MRTFLFALRLSFRQEVASKSGLFGRAALFVVILVVFSRLWRAAYASSNEAAADWTTLTWYMAVTELVVLSIPTAHLDIERDVRSGEVACQLARPKSYLMMQLARAAGATLAHLATLAPVGFLLTWWFTGTLPEASLANALVLPLAAAGALLASVFAVGIGIGAFWFQECGPLYWVWQKLLFTFGGLILPLSFYPEALRKVAAATPFSAMVNGPARLVLEGSAATAALSALKLAAWSAATLAAVTLVYARARRIIDVNGG